MKLSEIKKHLNNLESIGFELPDGGLVPSHFHVTEVGKITKRFIDCGGTIRNEEVINFQLWNKDDYDHRLHPEKLIHIIELSESALGLEDLEIEVEFQGSSTINKFSLGFNGINFLLINKETACLAEDLCVIPTEKTRVKMSDIQNQDSCCSPNSGCC